MIDRIDWKALGAELDELGLATAGRVLGKRDCRALADLSYAEVGALLECSQAAARRNAADGIARLRRHLGASPASPKQKDES